MKKRYYIGLFLIISIFFSFFFFPSILISNVSYYNKKINRRESVNGYFNLVRQNCFFSKYGEGPHYGNLIDPVVRGYGYCDQQSYLFILLCESMGVSAKMLHLLCKDDISCHTIGMCSIKEKWYLFDLTFGNLFKKDGKYLSIDKLKDNNELIKKIYNNRYEAKYYLNGTKKKISFVRKGILKIGYSTAFIYRPILPFLIDIYVDLLSVLGKTSFNRNYMKGRLYHFSDFLDDGIKYYRLALKEEEKKKDRVLFFIGKAYYDKNELKKAGEFFHIVTERNRDGGFKPEAYYYLYLINKKNEPISTGYLEKSKCWDASFLKHGYYQ